MEREVAAGSHLLRDTRQPLNHRCGDRTTETAMRLNEGKQYIRVVCKRIITTYDHGEAKALATAVQSGCSLDHYSEKQQCPSYTPKRKCFIV